MRECARRALLPLLLFESVVSLSLSNRALRPLLHAARRPSPVISLDAAREVTLEDWLGDENEAAVVLALSKGCQEVQVKLQTASCDSTSCFNNYQEEELAIDIMSDMVLTEQLRSCGSVAVAAIESDQVMIPLGPPRAESYAVMIDALDGSIDTNSAVSTLFGVWQSESLLNVTGRECLAAGACTYGPRTTLSLALAGREGVTEFLLVDSREPGVEPRWVKTNVYEAVGEGKLFAPGNLRASVDNEGFARLVQYWMDNQYVLRYSGGMVLDAMQSLIKGCGVFVSAAAKGQPPPPRLLFEAIPLAFLIEKGGGSSSDGERSLLDIMVLDIDQRTQMALGSDKEVQRFNDYVGPRSS